MRGCYENGSNRVSCGITRLIITIREKFTIYLFINLPTSIVGLGQSDLRDLY